jgi:hypothetical protein
MDRRPLVLSFLLPVLAACSDSSGGGASATPAPTGAATQMWIDTGGGGEARLSGMLQTVALEAADGSFTPDLLAGEQSVVLADASGGTSGVQLAVPPAGTFTAVHLLFVPGTLRADVGGQNVPVRTPDPQIRVPFRDPVTMLGERTWMVLRHRDVIELTPTGGETVWRPDVEADLRDLQLVRNEIVRIVRKDPAALAATAEVPAWDDAVVQLLFGSAEQLTLEDDDGEGEEVSPRAFVDELAPGQEVRLVLALAQEPARVWVLAASAGEDHAGRRHGHGRKSEVGGRIAALFPAREAFALDVTSVHKAGRGFPSPAPLRLDVLVDERTKIKWVPRLGRHTGHLDFDALEVDMQVDVEWFDPRSNNTVTAKKVDIRGRMPSPATASLSGLVRRVDAAGGEVAVGPLAGATLVWRGFESVLLEVDADTIVLRHRGNDLLPITLAEVGIGEPVWSLAEPRRDNTLRAVILLVEGQ